MVANSTAGSVSVINPATNTVVNTVTAIGGARGVAYDGKYIYVGRSGGSEVVVINPLTLGKVSVPTGSGSFGVVFDGTNVYVANQIAGTVSKLTPF